LHKVLVEGDISNVAVRAGEEHQIDSKPPHLYYLITKRFQDFSPLKWRQIHSKSTNISSNPIALNESRQKYLKKVLRRRKMQHSRKAVEGFTNIKPQSKDDERRLTEEIKSELDAVNQTVIDGKTLEKILSTPAKSHKGQEFKPDKNSHSHGMRQRKITEKKLLKENRRVDEYQDIKEDMAIKCKHNIHIFSPQLEFVSQQSQAKNYSSGFKKNKTLNLFGNNMKENFILNEPIRQETPPNDQPGLELQVKETKMSLEQKVQGQQLSENEDSNRNKEDQEQYIFYKENIGLSHDPSQEDSGLSKEMFPESSRFAQELYPEGNGLPHAFFPEDAGLSQELYLENSGLSLSHGPWLSQRLYPESRSSPKLPPRKRQDISGLSEVSYTKSSELFLEPFPKNELLSKELLSQKSNLLSPGNTELSQESYTDKKVLTHSLPLVSFFNTNVQPLEFPLNKAIEDQLPPNSGGEEIRSVVSSHSSSIRGENVASDHSQDPHKSYETKYFKETYPSHEKSGHEKYVIGDQSQNPNANYITADSNKYNRHKGIENQSLKNNFVATYYSQDQPGNNALAYQDKGYDQSDVPKGESDNQRVNDSFGEWSQNFKDNNFLGDQSQFLLDDQLLHSGRKSIVPNKAKDIDETYPLNDLVPDIDGNLAMNDGNYGHIYQSQNIGSSYSMDGQTQKHEEKGETHNKFSSYTSEIGR